MLYGVDVSEFQSSINWPVLNAVTNFVIIRASYGTVTDPQFKANQNGARMAQANAGPLGIGYYYYAYPTLLGAEDSARYFVTNLGPLQEGEVLALDLEGNVGPEPVAWSLDWLQTVELLTGVKPWIYLNQSEVSDYNWGPLIDNGNGLWLADYNLAKGAPAPVTPWGLVACAQWTDADVVGGISGKVDGDQFYGDINAWNAYGYKPAPVAQPAPPEPQPAPTPPPIEIPTPVATTPPAPTAEPAPSPSPVATPAPSAGPQPVPSTNPSKYALSITAIGQAITLQFTNFITAAGLYVSGHTQDIKPQVIAGLVLGALHLLINIVDDNVPNTPSSPD